MMGKKNYWRPQNPIQYLTKARNKYRDRHDGRRQFLYCEKCRIKDGLSGGQMRFGTCSFCGRRSRVYNNLGWENYYKTVGKTSPRQPGWRWQRGKAIWEKHKL
jgi:hypothetical protein